MREFIPYLLFMWLLLPRTTMASGLYGSGDGSEDSIAVSIHITDSLGNPSLTHADSFYISIIGPSGDSIIALAGLASSAGLNIDSLQTAGLGWQYVYAQAVSEIDGTGRAGTYELTFCAKDVNPKYVNCVRKPFQVIGSHLSTQLASITTILDSVLSILDTLQNQDDWVSSFDPADDTVFADASRISGDDQAADNLETMLDGTGGKRLSMAGMDINASGDDTAIVIKAGGTGTGLGLYILGGGNGGEGVKIFGGNTKSALVAEGGATVGSTHGFDLIGKGDGYGINGSISTASRQAIAGAVWDKDTASHNVIGSFAELLKDTSAYQGSASGLTAAEVADSVWGEMLDASWAAGSFGDSASGWGATAASSIDSGLIQRINNRHLDSAQNAHAVSFSGAAVDDIWDEMQSGHTSSGSFGAHLDVPVSSVGSSSGAGTYPVILTAFDTVNMQIVPGVKTSVYNLPVDALIAIGLTNTDGSVAFNLDSGAYLISAFAPGYMFGVFDTMSVNGATIDSVYGYRFDPGAPSSPELCRVYGFIYAIDGLPIEGATITAQLTDGVVRYDSLIISPYRRSTVTDSLGYFFIDLIPSGALDPAQTEYMVSANYPSGTILKKSILVPGQSSWLLAW